MTSESQVQNLIKEFNTSHRNNTFAEFIAELFKGKFVEIYLGDSYEEISTEQTSTAYPSVFCGRVVGAFKECLIINSVYIEGKTKHSKMSLGNMLFISERAIRALNEIDGKGVIEDMFLRSRESLIIKQEFVDK